MLRRPRRQSAWERVGHSSGLRDGHWKRVCDYLLVVEAGERLHAVFIELKKTLKDIPSRTVGHRARPDLKPRDQLRRSTPLLAYLRAVCEVESGDGGAGSIATRYFIVAEKRSQKLDKQPVRTPPASRVGSEQFENLTIRTFIGTRVSITTLIAD